MRNLNDPRRMEVLKTNLCRYPGAIGVTFQTMEGDSQVAEIVYRYVPLACQEPTRQAQGPVQIPNPTVPAVFLLPAPQKRCWDFGI